MAIKTGEFSSELIQGEKFDYFGFKVSFDNGQVLLQKNLYYFLEAKITGPDSAFGINGDSTVACPGVTFTFLNTIINDRTNIHRGQFPEFMFSL